MYVINVRFVGNTELIVGAVPPSRVYAVYGTIREAVKIDFLAEISDFDVVGIIVKPTAHNSNNGRFSSRKS